MRRALVVAAVLTVSLAVVTSSSSQAAPRVSVSVTASQPSPTGGRAPLGRREFSVAFHVAVSSAETCENLSVAYTYGTRFNGRPSLGESASESFDTGTPARTGAFEVRTTASPAEAVAFSARGTCEQADGTVLSASSRVAKSVRVPAHPCEQGPLRVLALHGSAKGPAGSLRAGNYLRTDDSVGLGRRSTIVFGAPQCRGFRVAITGSRSVAVRTGSYSSGSPGLATIVGAGANVDFRGDGHAGGVQTPNAIALPRAGRTASRFRLVASPDATTVRVRAGAVRVAARVRGSTYRKAIVVRAGHGVRCARRICA